MKKDFLIITATMLAVGLTAWSFVDHRHDIGLAGTEAARTAAHDPALKFYSEESPFMRSER